MLDGSRRTGHPALFLMVEGGSLSRSDHELWWLHGWPWLNECLNCDRLIGVSGLLQQMTIPGWLRQQSCISHSFRGWEVSGMGASMAGLWWEISCQFIGDCLLAVPKDSREQRQRSKLACLFLWGRSSQLRGFYPHDLRPRLLIPSKCKLGRNIHI